MLELLGLTPEQIAENESWDPKKGKRTRDFGDRVGDGIMSLITGTNYGQRVQDATRTQYVDDLKEVYGDRIERTKGVVGYDQLGDLSRMSRTALDEELTRRAETKAARSRTAAETGLDRSNFHHLKDPGEIIAAGARLVKDEADAKEVKAEAKDDRRYRDSQDLLVMNMMNQQEDRRSERELRRDQQAYQNRALDLKEARLDRNDRRAAIQQLMAGLSTLGASIAI